MRDQHDRHPETLLQRLQKIKDLGLDRNVEGGGRLIRYQDVRLVRERHGDHDALALTTGKLVRIAVYTPLGLRNSDEPQQFENARARLLLLPPRW